MMAARETKPRLRPEPSIALDRVEPVAFLANCIPSHKPANVDSIANIFSKGPHGLFSPMANRVRNSTNAAVVAGKGPNSKKAITIATSPKSNCKYGSIGKFIPNACDNNVSRIESAPKSPVAAIILLLLSLREGALTGVV